MKDTIWLIEMEIDDGVGDGSSVVDLNGKVRKRPGD